MGGRPDCTKAGTLESSSSVRRLHVIAAMAVVVLASPVLAWFAVGDTSEAVPNPDYMFRPPSLSTTQELALGATAFALGAAAAVVVVSALRSGVVALGELAPAVPLLLAGAFLGLAARIVTAGVSGANIGGGLVILFGPFVLLALVVWSVILWRRAAAG
jgi:hypothetical protein